MKLLSEEIPTLSPEKISSIIKDSVKSAEAVNLVYVKDIQPGIKRLKRGKHFYYVFEGERINDKSDLQRIKHLVIPPAWENVWICSFDNGHLQATGFDIKKRKQYRYHPLWNLFRNHTKFYRLYEFGLALSKIRLQLEKDLLLPGLPLEKVLALVVSIMERTNIRIGNDVYEKLYGSYGLTTLKDKHVQFSGNSIQFKFKGKKGIHHSISITSKKLAGLIKKCQDIPGKELFQYVTVDGGHKSIDSGMVNEYIRKISGEDFSAKDFRTWSGSLHALMAFKQLGCGSTQSEAKKKISEALDLVSQQLGNTRNVCKKYYIHPVIISLFENNQLTSYLNKLDELEKGNSRNGLTCEEKILMSIFEKELHIKK